MYINIDFVMQKIKMQYLNVLLLIVNLGLI
jgi:hypothetical protein